MFAILVIVAVLVAAGLSYFAPVWAWLPIVAVDLVIIHVYRGVRRHSFRPPENLSPAAVSLFTRFGHFYHYPFAGKQLSSACSLLALGGVVPGTIATIRGQLVAAGLAAANYFVMQWISWHFNPELVLKDEDERRAHLEALERLHPSPETSSPGEAVNQRPEWASSLPPQIQLSTSQVERLEIVRNALGVPHTEFFLHIQSHPEATKHVQRALFGQMQRDDPSASDEQLLVQLVYSRYMSARMVNQDLFGLHRYSLPDPAHPGPEFIGAMIQLVRTRRWRTVDEFTEALVAEEAGDMPGDVPPHPSAREAVDQISRVMRERPTQLS